MENGVTAPDRDAEIAALNLRKADLEATLKARDGKPGYGQNCKFIRDLIASIDKEIAANGG